MGYRFVSCRASLLSGLCFPLVPHKGSLLTPPGPHCSCEIREHQLQCWFPVGVCLLRPRQIKKAFKRKRASSPTTVGTNSEPKPDECANGAGGDQRRPNSPRPEIKRRPNSPLLETQRRLNSPRLEILVTTKPSPLSTRVPSSTAGRHNSLRNAQC